MAKTDQAGAKQKRPIVTQTAINQARQVVAARFGAELAKNLSDGDAVSMAMALLTEGDEAK